MIEIREFVNSIFDSNSYLLESGESSEAWMIDVGDVTPVSDYLASNNKTLKGVLLTHTHFDHIYGLNHLVDKFSELVVYTSLHGKEGLRSDKLNMSRYNLQPFTFFSDRVEIVKEGTQIELFESVHAEVYETPGHDWSSLCYKVENNFFTGDSYLPQYDLIASLPKSNKEDAMRSLERIKELSAGCNLCPGHGDIVYA